MAGRNSTSKQAGPQTIAVACHDQGVLDEFRAFRLNVPDTGPHTQVSSLLNKYCHRHRHVTRRSHLVLTYLSFLSLV